MAKAKKGPNKAQIDLWLGALQVKQHTMLLEEGLTGLVVNAVCTTHPATRRKILTRILEQLDITHHPSWSWTKPKELI